MDNRLQIIYRKADGYCHICHKKLSFSNYALYGSKGAWEVEHSKARANGGSDHLNNLFAACIPCNRDKGTKHTKTARSKYGNTRAPYSKTKKKQIQNERTVTGGIVGGIVGSMFGPLGTFIGAGIGAAIGHDSTPRK